MWRWGPMLRKMKPPLDLQFHPEVYHTTEGKTILYNFLWEICGCSMDWTPETFVESTVQELKKKLGNDRVVLGLIGRGGFNRGSHPLAPGHWHRT